MYIYLKGGAYMHDMYAHVRVFRAWMPCVPACLLACACMLALQLA